MNMYNVKLPKANKNKIVLSEIISANYAYVKNPIHFGKPAAQVSNKIDLRHGWNLLPKTSI